MIHNENDGQGPAQYRSEIPGEPGAVLLREFSFTWDCPECEAEQAEIVTIDGPVMSLTCVACCAEFGPDKLPEPIRVAWYDAIDRVIPKGED